MYSRAVIGRFGKIMLQEESQTKQNNMK